MHRKLSQILEHLDLDDDDDDDDGGEMLTSMRRNLSHMLDEETAGEMLIESTKAARVAVETLGSEIESELAILHRMDDERPSTHAELTAGCQVEPDNLDKALTSLIKVDAIAVRGEGFVRTPEAEPYLWQRIGRLAVAGGLSMVASQVLGPKPDCGGTKFAGIGDLLARIREVCATLDMPLTPVDDNLDVQ